MYFDWIEAYSTMPRLLHWVTFQRNIVMCKRVRASACYKEGMLSYQCTYDRAFASRNTHSLSYPVQVILFDDKDLQERRLRGRRPSLKEVDKWAAAAI